MFFSFIFPPNDANSTVSPSPDPGPRREVDSSSVADGRLRGALPRDDMQVLHLAREGFLVVVFAPWSYETGTETGLFGHIWGQRIDILDQNGLSRECPRRSQLLAEWDERCKTRYRVALNLLARLQVKTRLWSCVV